MMLATSLLGLSMIEGGMLGFIIAAVSPAVVVPSKLELKDRNIGSDKGIPTICLRGDFCDQKGFFNSNRAIYHTGDCVSISSGSDTTPVQTRWVSSIYF